MAETLMAGFGQTQVEVRTLSESNSVTYRLVACSATSKSVPATSYVYMNDVPYGSQAHGTGINVRVFNDANEIVSTRSFATTPNESTMNAGFIDFMSTLNPFPIVLITTFGNTRTSPLIDAWFKSVGSASWPGSYLFTNYNYAYVGIYSSIHKKILSEVHYGDDLAGTEKGRAKLEVVYDKPRDVGMTGFPGKVIYDPVEYSSTSAYEFKRYPDERLIAPMSEFGIVVGTKYTISADLFASKALFDNNMTTRMSVRWYNGASLIKSTSIDVPASSVDQWYRALLPVDVPTGVDGFTIVAARFPRNDAITAKGGIKNAMMTQIAGDKTARMAAIGVNGIMSNNIIDGTPITNLITEIHDSTLSTDNTIPLVGIKERPLDY